MDHPLTAADSHVRPWRMAAYVAGTVAVVELVLLLVIGGGVLVRTASDRIQLAAHETVAATPAAEFSARATTKRKAAVPAATRSRGKTVVLVLNGNGRTGAAASAATRVRGRGYPISSVGNAPRSDYRQSIVMYRPGYAGEGQRLARDLRVKMVGPLDGMRAGALGRAHLVFILGS